MNHYLTAIHSIDLPERERKVPRERFEGFVDDLYTLYSSKISHETLTEGGQYMYTELGDALLEMEAVKPLLPQVDLIIVAHWSQEFDPDEATCSTYFLKKHHLLADIFDVTDLGTIAPFMAIKLLLEYQRNHTSRRGMVLCLEQSTIPRRKEDGDIIPQNNGALAMFISQASSSSGLHIYQAGIFSENIAMSSIKEFHKFLKNLLSEYQIRLEDTYLILRKGTLIWRLLSYAREAKYINLQSNQIGFIEPQPGCLSAMKALNKVMNGSSLSSYSYTLLLDEDVESLMVSYIILGDKKNESYK